MNDSYYRSLEPYFGSWRIKEFIGQGSYGQVYTIEKEDLSGSYISAMKIISVVNDRESENFAGGMTEQNLDEYYDDLTKNIIKEFKMMEQLKGNTNVVCYEDHEIRKRPDGHGYDIFIRMEYLTPITKHFGAAFPGEEEIIRLGIDICRALELCHKNNIIHRDVKPQNLFISPTGDYKLGDFGVARTFENAVSEFSTKGTFDYMAPEVQLRQPYGVTADIFSLGAVLYKLMNNGRIAFLPDYPETVKSSDYEKAFERRLSGENPKKPMLASNAFANVILRACKADPEQRYDSAEKMRHELEAVADMLKNGSNLQYTDYSIGENGEGVILTGGSALKRNEQQNTSVSQTQQQAPTVQQNPVQAPQPNYVQVPQQDHQMPQPNSVQYPQQNVQIPQQNYQVPQQNTVQIPQQTPAQSNQQTIQMPAMESGTYGTHPGISRSFPKNLLDETEIQKRKAGEKKKKSFVPILVAIIVLAAVIAAGAIFFATNPGIFSKEPQNPNENITEQPITVVNPVEEWKVEGYEEKYPFYAIEHLFVDGAATDEYRISDVITRYSEDEAKIFYSIDLDTGVATRTLYLNGAPTDYVETVVGMSDDEWVIEGYMPDTFEEFARRYVNGVMTDEYCKTGRTFESAYYVKIDDNKNMERILYVDGKPVSSTPISELSHEEWVLDGFEVDTFREYAIKYVDGVKTQEAKRTGLVFKSEDYYVYDKTTDMYYLITYVNNIPMTNTIRGHISNLAGLEEAWVVSEYYNMATYEEYAERHVYGVKTDETRYTGAKKQIIEWIVEGYRSYSPYYQYERKYLNGEKTNETRNTYPLKTDPSRVQSSSTSTPTPVQPTPVQPAPQPEIKYYMNPDGSINFSELELKYWYDAEEREYKIWYDKDGNEVIRFATGAYKVHRN